MLRNYAFILIALLMGCQQLGISTPKSFDQKLAYAYGVHTSVLQGATVALNAKAISSSDAAHVATLGDQSRQLLDAARLVAATDPNAANAKLLLATQILEQLQVYLRGK